jgi:hypothetical protein
MAPLLDVSGKSTAEIGTLTRIETQLHAEMPALNQRSIPPQWLPSESEISRFDLVVTF